MQQRIGIAFRDPSLLREALTHSSFANESPHVSPRDNERLEYLGDAVLQLITAEYLFKLRPGSKEGEMTQIRSAMVNTNTLAALAEELGLGGYLYLGKGIARGGGRSLKSLLANAFESVLGAIFLDAGYDAAYHYYLDRFRALPEPVQDENHKGRLQQVVQEKFGQTPYYDSVSARGGRQREYTAVVYAGAEPLGTGHGTTKQGAEQDAARNALAELSRRDAAGRSARRPRRREDQPADQPGPPEQTSAAQLDGRPDPDEPQAADRPQDQDSTVPLAPPAASEATAAPEPPRPRRRRRKPAAQPADQADTQPAVGQPAVEQPAGPPTAPPRRSRRRRPQTGAAPEAEAPQAATGNPIGDPGQP
ncbi:ribonuclease III [Candidatus Nephthysia bennettiae]|uniref:Ribonuclease 3 n=1 Tax=Candidatus Nephthysia bennettiae TaxID=3127016 RepID=A0A934KCD1_9BACT|nr:ribonuclease III [Candidatus Dormibacteraeota bacterium]MBJ7611115.1 ribonuclease III [Candidatus Dormibacteraeota bacterium]